MGFAISAASINSDSIFSLMKKIIYTIIDRYGNYHNTKNDKVKFSVIVYGQVITTSFTFDNAKFTQEDLIRTVNETTKVPGTPDLEKALKQAETLFRKTSRANATKVFVAMSDSVSAARGNQLIVNAAKLRRQGVLILSVGIGANYSQIGNQMKKVVITHSDFIGVPDFTTRPVVIAETIMFKALQGNVRWICARDIYVIEQE